MRFGIRDLLWLTVVAAVSVCWFIDRRSVATTKAALEADRLAARAAESAATEEKASLLKTLEVVQKLGELYDDRRRPIYYPPKNDGI